MCRTHLLIRIAISFHWPARDQDGDWLMRGVRLDWHRNVAKAAVRKMLDEIRNETLAPLRIAVNTRSSVKITPSQANRILTIAESTRT